MKVTKLARLFKGKSPTVDLIRLYVNYIKGILFGIAIKDNSRSRIYI